MPIGKFCEIWLAEYVQVCLEFNIFHHYQLPIIRNVNSFMKTMQIAVFNAKFHGFPMIFIAFFNFFQNLVSCQKSFLTQNFFSSQQNDLIFGHSQDITLRNVFPESYQTRIDGFRDFFIFIHQFLQIFLLMPTAVFRCSRITLWARKALRVIFLLTKLAARGKPSTMDTARKACRDCA